MKFLHNAEEMLMKRTNGIVSHPSPHTAHSQLGPQGGGGVCGVQHPPTARVVTHSFYSHSTLPQGSFKLW